MIYFDGVPVDPAAPAEESVRPLLAAITIEQRRRTRTTPGVLVGTRVAVHLGLIYQFLPDLFDQPDQEN